MVTQTFKPLYGVHGNIKFPEKEINKVIEESITLSEVRPMNAGKIPDNTHLTTFFLEADKRPDKIWSRRYSKIMENLIKQLGVFTTTQYVYEYWSQLYFKEGLHDVHHHQERADYSAISWVHFLRTPQEKCFVFLDQDGQKYIPEDQHDGDLIFFPSYLWHEVLPPRNNNKRLVVAGNLHFTYFTPC